MKSVIQKDLLKTNKDKCIHMSSENSSVSEKSVSQPKEKNRGTGAGGANTNKNGKELENMCRSYYNKHIKSKKLLNYCSKNRKFLVEEVVLNDKTYIHAPGNAFRCFETNCGFANSNEKKAHGAKEPDDCFINVSTKTLNWIECKFQQGPGSVGEKIQTCSEKIINLERRFPGWNINYCYIINQYIKDNYEWEIERLDEKGISCVNNDGDLEIFEKKILALIK